MGMQEMEKTRAVMEDTMPFALDEMAALMDEMQGKMKDMHEMQERNTLPSAPPHDMQYDEVMVMPSAPPMEDVMSSSGDYDDEQPTMPDVLEFKNYIVSIANKLHEVQENMSDEILHVQEGATRANDRLVGFAEKLNTL